MVDDAFDNLLLSFRHRQMVLVAIGNVEAAAGYGSISAGKSVLLKKNNFLAGFSRCNSSGKTSTSGTYNHDIGVFSNGVIVMSGFRSGLLELFNI